MTYVASRTSIPVSRVLHLNLQTDHPLGVYMLLEKVCATNHMRAHLDNFCRYTVSNWQQYSHVLHLSNKIVSLIKLLDGQSNSSDIDSQPSAACTLI